MDDHTYVSDSVVIASRRIEHDHVKQSPTSSILTRELPPISPEDSTLLVAAPWCRGGCAANQRDQNGPKESVECAELENYPCKLMHGPIDSH